MLLIYPHYSDLNKLYYVTAVVCRFIYNIKNRDKKLNDEITSSEISDAELLWIKSEQGFILKNKEFNQVKLSLNLFTDEKGLLRLGSRLKESLMSFENAHPILLRHSYFTRLLVECMHKEVLHSGLHATLNYIRSRFWICRGRHISPKYIT